MDISLGQAKWQIRLEVGRCVCVWGGGGGIKSLNVVNQPLLLVNIMVTDILSKEASLLFLCPFLVGFNS